MIKIQLRFPDGHGVAEKTIKKYKTPKAAYDFLTKNPKKDYVIVDDKGNEYSRVEYLQKTAFLKNDNRKVTKNEEEE